MKRAAALVALFLSFVLPSGAQDAFSPLIYAEEVAQTMKMIQQIQDQLREVSYIYQSLQNQIQSLSSMKMSSYSDFMSFLNGQASYVLTTESRIKALQIYVNGESYALGDVFGYWDAYKKKINDISQGNGTSSDEWAAYELLGMSERPGDGGAAAQGPYDECGKKVRGACGGQRKAGEDRTGKDQ